MGDLETESPAPVLSAPLSVLVPRELKRWVAQEAARRTRELGVKVSVGAIVRAALEAYRGQPNPPRTTT